MYIDWGAWAVGITTGWFLNEILRDKKEMKEMKRREKL